jgi:hypothetical protein
MLKFLHFERSIFCGLLLIVFNALGYSQPVRINEVMASNSAFFSDEDNSYPDWIELHNAGSQPVNLNGYGLSDNKLMPFKWVFPAIVIQPNEYLVVWASGKDRRTLGSALHTNFRIEASGEDLILTRPDGVVMDEMPAIMIPTDVSYGRLPHLPDTWAYFLNPTIGAANVTPSYHGISASPEIQPPGGAIFKEIAVTITSDDQNGEIYYTTDGSIPSKTNGTKYTQPFMVNDAAVIKALTLTPGKLPSAVISANYTLGQDRLSTFASNLPVMVIQTYGDEIIDGDRIPAYMSLIAGRDDGTAALNTQTAYSGRIMINIRGTSSLSFPKKGYGFHTVHEDGTTNKISLLGMPEDHNWILHGPYSDKTLMRNVLAYSISADMGHYAPRTRYIELYLHNDDQPLSKDHYQGVYVLVERIKISSDRVDVEELEQHQNSWPEVSGGYIFRIDRETPDDIQTMRGSKFNIVRPDAEDITPAQRNYLISFLDTIEAGLFTDDLLNHPIYGYDNYIDKLSFIDMHLITELAKEIDGFRWSFYYYKDRMGKLKAGPVWDYNLSFGNVNYLNGWIPTGWYHSDISENAYAWGWYSRMFKDPDFDALYKKRYRMLRTSAFSEANILGKIDKNYRLLKEAQERNFERWDILGRAVWPNYYIGNTYEEEVNWMKNWIRQRLAWMDSQLGQPYTTIHYWNFNDESLQVPTYSVSYGMINYKEAGSTEITSGSGQNFTGMNARNGDDAGNHLRINNPIGAEATFNVSTKGYNNIIFSYETRRSGSGANRQYISYSTNGSTFIAIDTVYVKATPALHMVDFSSITAAANNSSFAVRITFDHDPAAGGGTEGNVRIDNVSVDGEAMQGVVRPLVQTGALPVYIEMIEGSQALTYKLDDYFKHPDNRILNISVKNEKNDVATANISNGNIVIAPQKRGGTRVELNVSDNVNPVVKKVFYVMVYPKAFRLAEGRFVFSNWSKDEREGSFPEHMVFTQSAENDPDLVSDVHFAYSIPASDYSSDDQNNIGFPYRNSTRTRINGLDAEGISFINTGRGRDVGALVLSLDTRGADPIILSWIGTTIKANSRQYAIRMQYRTDIYHVWKTVIGYEDEPVEYYRNQDGHTQLFYNVRMPADAYNQANLQFRWLYYYTGGQADPEAGARDMLGLKLISINDPTNVDEAEDPHVPLTAFPNPSKPGIVYFNREISGYLYDIHGRVIISFQKAKEISTREIQGGLYLIRTDSGETLKIVVQK